MPDFLSCPGVCTLRHSLINYLIVHMFLPTVARVSKDATYTGVIILGVGVTCEYISLETYCYQLHLRHLLLIE